MAKSKEENKEPEVEEKEQGHPVYMYRSGKEGEVESEIFDSNNIPKGWVDSPAKLKGSKSED